MVQPGGGALRRAAIVDASSARRGRARELLTRRLGMSVVDESASLHDLAMRLRGTDRAGRPQMILLVSASLADGPELEALAACRAAGLRVVALVPGAGDRTMCVLRDAGVDGIVSSLESERVVLAVIDAVRRRARAWSPRARAVLAALPVRPALSPQEERLVVLYGAGHTIGEVAERIGVREDTARKYLNRVKAKYAAVGRPVHTKVEIARVARADGLLTGTDGDRGVS